MKYWAHVDIGDHELIAHKVLVFSLKNIDLKTCKFWNPLPLDQLELAVPELVDGVAKLGTRIKEASLLVLKYDTSAIHIDHTIGANAGVKARLNIPVLNTEDSRTAFFTLEELGDQYTIDLAGSKTWASGEKRKLFKSVDEVSVTKPTILRTSAPHTVFCDSNRFPRITLTMSFEKDAESFLLK